MCNRYVSPVAGDIERYWHVGGRNPWRGGEVFPRAPGPFVRGAHGTAHALRGARGTAHALRGARDTAQDLQAARSSEPARELVVGQWGLVPWFAKSAKLAYATNNARFEEITAKASYKHSWAQGKRCIIPALSFDEPCWESGRNVWWRFRRADGAPWALAGLWNTWTDQTTGEVVESYTMLTLNADAHALMRRMHKPDPKLGPEQQDKRSVVAIEPADVDAWLHATPQQAAMLVRLSDPDLFDAGPAVG